MIRDLNIGQFCSIKKLQYYLLLFYLGILLLVGFILLYFNIVILSKSNGFSNSINVNMTDCCRDFSKSISEDTFMKKQQVVKEVYTSALIHSTDDF